MASLAYSNVRDAVISNAAAFRCCRTLQPAGGAGTKVFPPTYAGSVYALEHRRLPKRELPIPCVLLDSVQSQANRMEEALQDALDQKRISIPIMEVDFTGANLIDPIGKITSLQVPHRIADAILRDSELDGMKFRESDRGKEVDSAGPLNATPLYRLCPTALFLGMWDSTGPKGGLGVKIERAIVAEIVGIGVALAEKNRGIRRDPLQIVRSVAVIGTSSDWTVAKDPKAKGALRPSEINHSSVPFDNENAGVTIESAEQTITLSLIALRRLRFPIKGKTSPDIDAAAHAVLAALALCAATLSAEKGLDLRSRCLLWPDGPMEWELLAKPGVTPERFTLDSEASIKLLNEAVAHAAKVGLTWIDEPVRLVPSKQLVELVRRSQEVTAKGVADEGGTDVVAST
ncbi:MAG TPA: type I-U CRISPR-associated RAMP protein Csb1/Cas7u [Tepidisphaeraceae bacterium]|nr:type I-U CRISPR-associated RAMP protein Csb1/Cas7u [Tepidisphaeraceae bacterium]